MRTIAICIALTIGGCAGTFKDIANTLDAVADAACMVFGAENPDEFAHLVRTVLPPGATMDEAEKVGFDPAILCRVKEVVQPFIDDQLRLQVATRAGLRAGMSGVE